MSGEANVLFIYIYLFIGWFVVICTPDPTCVTLASSPLQGFKCVHVVLSAYSCILLSKYYSAFTLELQPLLLSPKMSSFLVLFFHRRR